jgi:hypothetical protein
MPWVTAPADLELLRGRYDAYVGAVGAAAQQVLARGCMLLLHSYAPREVDVQVDMHIVENLHKAYTPELEPTWPLRPEVDVIGRAVDGTSHVPPPLLALLREELGARGLQVADGQTYPLHPSTLAYGHVARWPGRVLCVEVRRDLLADPFEPFVQMRIGAEKVKRIGDALAAVYHRWMRPE